MSINASDVAHLRAITGAGMMDCKTALEEAVGDMEKAAEILRKKGIVKAAKRAEKVAAEGIVSSFVDDAEKIGALAEVNCETDFVAKSDSFLIFSKSVAEAIVSHGPSDVAFLAQVKLTDGKTVEETMHELALKIGEKISLRRFVRYHSDDGRVYSYVHGAKIGVLVETAGGDKETATDIAMHIAASNPRYLDRGAVPEEVIAKEKEIYAEQLKVQGKPPNIIESILKGKIDKFYGEACLLEQAFIKNEDLTVGKYAESKGTRLLRFVRFELGEGIEKIRKDFASEVAEQLE